MKILSCSHAQHCLGYHIIFCPKYRHQILEGAVEVELKRILGEVCKTYNWTLHARRGDARPRCAIRLGENERL
ncbi:transposase [Microseira wollei]|uniref:transposase n=1 Tax=Microseira wollei TaxID=467598 RepID=UPI0021F64132|nr:transposase [Microseira wollei]